MGVVINSTPPAALLPGMNRYPLLVWLGGPQGQSERVRKISRPLGFDPHTVQPVVSCCNEGSVLKFPHASFNPPHTAYQEILRLWNMEFHCSAQQGLKVRTITGYLFKSHFNERGVLK
jgi:hypothetical protein